MPHDRELAERVRAALAAESGVTETAMFGGLAFLVDGTMALAASGQGGLMLRVEPDEQDDLLARPEVEPMVMRGREMAGWLRVHVDGTADDAVLAEWVGRGVRRARSV